MTKTITRSELKSRLESDENITLIEALPKNYYDSGHLPGAINLPHDEMSVHADRVLPDKDATIVVYCANTECQNSHTGAQILSLAGYTHVLEYVEGKQDWQQAGFILEKS